MKYLNFNSIYSLIIGVFIGPLLAEPFYHIISKERHDKFCLFLLVSYYIANTIATLLSFGGISQLKNTIFYKSYKHLTTYTLYLILITIAWYFLHMPWLALLSLILLHVLAFIAYVVYKIVNSAKEEFE